MNEADLAAQLAVLLEEELGDRIPDLDRVLLALGRSPDDATLRQELHRLLHVVKGASRSAGKTEIEAGAHDIETQLATVDDGATIPADMLQRAGVFVASLEVARGKITGASGSPLQVTPDPLLAEQTDSQIRVSADDLDVMLAHSAAILVARQGLADPIRRIEEIYSDLVMRRALNSTQVATLSRQLAEAHRELVRDVKSLTTASSLLDVQVRRSRLRSILDACRGCERLVHDSAASMGKVADLVVHGGEVRVDRAQIQTLRDVLIQLLRNAVAHGIESPELRERSGKPARGRIAIHASAVGDAVRIEVTDDGAGLDLEAIGKRSAAQGMHVETNADAVRAIFAPGLSTAEEISELAGRGVGLDVAKQRIEAMHGSIAVDSVRGQSTTFTITLPTTVATITALVVTCQGVAYAIPSSAVERVVRIDRTSLRHVDSRYIAPIGTAWLTIGALSNVLGGAAPAQERGVAMVLSQAGRRVAVQVDAITAIYDLAVGPLDPRLGRVRHLTGQARLPSGDVSLVLNANDVIEDILGTAVASPPPRTRKAARRRILVVDDSATTRALEANILRTAGYDVALAVDGTAALRQLAEAHFDLVVSDVDMPNLDGFGLTEAVRAIERFATLPVILVTARSTDADRARGLRVGASAYLVKSSFDQSVLLQTIERLL